MKTLIQKAANIAGGTEALARRLSCSRQAISQWHGKVPRGRALEIELITGGAVTRHQLRPDLFPPEDSSESAA